jgi:hypothetical protein
MALSRGDGVLHLHLTPRATRNCSLGIAVGDVQIRDDFVRFHNRRRAVASVRPDVIIAVVRCF